MADQHARRNGTSPRVRRQSRKGLESDINHSMGQAKSKEMPSKAQMGLANRGKPTRSKMPQEAEDSILNESHEHLPQSLPPIHNTNLPLAPLDRQQFHSEAWAYLQQQDIALEHSDSDLPSILVDILDHGEQSARKRTGLSRSAKSAKCAVRIRSLPILEHLVSPPRCKPL